MKTSKVTRRHKAFALAGVTAVALPLALTPVLSSGSAHAQTNTGNQATQSTQSNTANQAPVGSFAPIVAKVKPAVVTVTTEINGNNASDSDDDDDQDQGMTPFEPGSPMDRFFRQFFGENGPNGPNGRSGPMPQMPHGREEALGSGFIIDQNGTIVTNNHVVKNASSVEVTLDDGSQYKAKVLGTDEKTDLAVLKIDASKQLPTVQWDDSNHLKLGDPVLALGNPFGIGTTVTSGIISARGRDLHNGPYDDFLQVDAAINHGNSGGPLVDMNGKVVGINSAIYSPNGGNVGVGFAIPSNQASQIVSKLIKSGSIERGFIGVQIQPVTEDVANAIGLDKASGALVASVGDDSPAKKAGIKTGDVITKFQNKDISGPRDLARKVADVTPGQEASITVFRNGDTKQLSIDIAKYANNVEAMNSKSSEQPKPDQHGSAEVSSLGFSLANLTQERRQQYQIDSDEKGVVVSNVKDNGSADEHGLREGDVILSINQQSVDSANKASELIQKAKKSDRKSVLLLVDRGGQQTFIALPFDQA
ncbi:DegQ family serine endoprotease [Pararhizobium mangrovi]|uniref:Probable periplasmic serine endoprotease DegP-like n=1 Tax=Pararhizobium mangrovi TaxID=2590452 RepID=A0A506UH16_9HYPH|nr:DegQ family serine endoprotease [Pararhizobium mangrovi]TPW31947.1 DegQ family serine endoprotease [Pararhizobium mangrovi]